ncbi:6-carboxy-5,6,7,8-tetrahydropterin synthase [Caloramator mitchellensis]|uniref:6-carboxy-5,6,7,8-tetrahydropterin synthase n=1 Tax=Caloramator mitchellensis TaxID=908809 RepID=A0A0R3K1T4_CALMK|nr:6-carboxytetrahydropterin synthase QueD [Caloramator mitchellensis]KRQ86255.1 6-carboxy-5,6,7,8-tetrahydropterin synthase [Caloramator mitchellensis]
MKLTVTKEFTFDCAHMLSNHDGLCSNLHGHTYKLEVTASAQLIKEGSSKGMVVDFGDLKSIVKETIVDKFDHSFLFWEEGSEAEKEIARVVENFGMRIVKFKERPTAENMAIYIINTLNENLENGIKIVRVRLYETPTSYAEVEIDV